MIIYIYIDRFISSCYVVVGVFCTSGAFHSKLRNDSSDQVQVCVCVNHLKRCKTFNLLNFRYWVFSHRVSVLLCFVALSPVVLCAAVCSTACQGWVPVCFFPTSPPFSSLVLPACCVLPSGCFCRCVFLLFPVVICRLLSSFPSSSPPLFFRPWGETPQAFAFSTAHFFPGVIAMFWLMHSKTDCKVGPITSLTFRQFGDLSFPDLMQHVKRGHVCVCMCVCV